MAGGMEPAFPTQKISPFSELDPRQHFSRQFVLPQNQKFTRTATFSPYCQYLRCRWPHPMVLSPSSQLRPSFRTPLAFYFRLYRTFPTISSVKSLSWFIPDITVPHLTSFSKYHTVHPFFKKISSNITVKITDSLAPAPS